MSSIKSYLEQSARELSIASNDRVNDLLKELNATETDGKITGLTKDDLKSTGIGKELAKLMKHSEQNISSMAKAIVEKWKSLVKV